MYTRFTAGLLMLFLVFSVTAGKTLADDATSAADPFVAAVAKAKNERKYLFVVVNQDDCPRCATLESKTLHDPKVTAWCDLYALVVSINSSTEFGRAFATEHRVQSFPTVLFMASDGREIGRLAGFMKPGRFQIKINEVINGDTIRTDALAGPWSGEDVLEAAIDRAASLVSDRKYADALAQYAWCLDHKAAHSNYFLNSKFQHLMRQVVALGEKYPPARKDIEDRIAMAERETVYHRRATTYLFYLIKYGYTALGEEEKIVAHYDVMKDQLPDSASTAAFGKIIYGPLLRAKHYQDIQYSVQNTGELDTILEREQETGKSDPETKKILLARYEVLLGLKKDSEARDVSDRFLKLDNSTSSYIRLAEAGERSGRVTNDLLRFARRAYLYSGRKNVHSSIVLARLLEREKANNPQAMQILNESLEAATADVAKKALQSCITEIQNARKASRNVVKTANTSRK